MEAEIAYVVASLCLQMQTGLTCRQDGAGAVVLDNCLLLETGGTDCLLLEDNTALLLEA